MGNEATFHFARSIPARKGSGGETEWLKQWFVFGQWGPKPHQGEGGIGAEAQPAQARAGLATG